MSEPTQGWVADFHLVDPSTLARTHDIDAARLMTVRALMQGRPSYLEGKSDRDRYRAVGQTLRNLAHDAEAPMLQKLGELATVKGALQFYYCARCGEKLTPQKCPRCNISYKPNDPNRLVAVTAPPVIPAIIAAYAVQQGTRFRQFVIRPRRP
jgi:cytochrome c peroxidase